MSSPSASFASAADVADKSPAPIGRVIVTMYGLKPGDATIVVEYPRNAMPGARGASAAQDAFRNAVLAELQTTFARGGP
jgi:hypothetical protein